MDSIQAYLETLKQGGKQNHLNMTTIPLLTASAGEPDYLTLEEGLSKELVIITEISTGGNVPDLKLINGSPDKVLVVDGEELIGAKQNRIINASFLIAGNTEITIPVSCVEQGRWSYRSHKFASGEKIMPAAMRFSNQRNVTMNLKEGSGFRSDQRMIWNELAAKSDRMAVHSSTGAMADLFEGQKDRLGEYLKAFRPVDCQIGAVFTINGKVGGLECFGYQKTFGSFFPKLVQSYALDALDWLSDSQETQAPAESVRTSLKGCEKFPANLIPLLDWGKTYGSRIILSLEPHWSMKGDFYTCQLSAIMGIKMTE